MIEAAGIPTVTLQLVWPFQRMIGMARVAAIEHPFARPFGDVSDVATQRSVLLAALAVFQNAREPGYVEHLPMGMAARPRRADELASGRAVADLGAPARARSGETEEGGSTHS